MTSISVKSKYGSCSGNCTGIININKTPINSSYSSTVERNTVNILIYVRFIFEASAYRETCIIIILQYICNYQ